MRCTGTSTAASLTCVSSQNELKVSLQSHVRAADCFHNHAEGTGPLAVGVDVQCGHSPDQPCEQRE